LRQHLGPGGWGTSQRARQAYNGGVRLTERETAGHRLLWSTVFPVKPGADIPPEGFLHLPQKQKFKASVFLEGRTIAVEKAAVALDGTGGGRISLGDRSKVSAGEPFEDWRRLAVWQSEAALERLRRYEPTPLDLEVDLQEEVVLDPWEAGTPEPRDGDRQLVYPILHGAGRFEAPVSTGGEAEPLRKYLDAAARRKERPPLFGLLHYELGRLVLQPLSVFGERGPGHLTISTDKIDPKALLKAERFQLFVDVTGDSLTGVVKSQSDPDLVYSCRLCSDGAFACCTQNLNPCGGLRGAPCKHLLVLVVGLAQASEIDAATVDNWLVASEAHKPALDKDAMSETFLRYKGAEAGEIDCRPTETIPEDFYAL